MLTIFLSGLLKKRERIWEGGSMTALFNNIMCVTINLLCSC